MPQREADVVEGDTVTAVLVAPDHWNAPVAGGRLDLRGLAASFRVPRKAPDFY